MLNISEPSEDGLIAFDVLGPPVSLQSHRARKADTITAIRSAMGNPHFLLSGDVAIEIEWFVHESLRYENLTTPDVDNILKVTLDALAGPQGIMVNDCQVQSVCCHWIDWTDFDQRFSVQIRYQPDEWIIKNGLRFVKFAKSLCFPLNERIPGDALLASIGNIQHILQRREDMEAKGLPYEASHQIMPIQRPFHVGHLQGFNVTAVSVLRRKLERS
jgi:Holliday junction resolvase RusA-like endonuclease